MFAFAVNQHEKTVFYGKVVAINACLQTHFSIYTSIQTLHNALTHQDLHCLINPYKPSFLFVAHRQTVQAQTRHHKALRLIRVSTVCSQNEACIGVLGIQGISHFTSRDIGYYPFYFQGYRILSILLPGIWDTVFNNFLLLSGILNI